MFRRSFIQRLTAAGAAGWGGVEMVRAADVEGVTVQYKVKGFTCVTCAVGLEVMLHRRPGVLRVRASYPDASVQICFNPDAVSEPALKEFIVAQGFSVESSQPSS